MSRVFWAHAGRTRPRGARRSGVSRRDLQQFRERQEDPCARRPTDNQNSGAGVASRGRLRGLAQGCTRALALRGAFPSPESLSKWAFGARCWAHGPAPAPGRARTSPCVMKLAISAPLTALSRSQSEKMISGDLPPSSKVTGLMPFADISMILQNKNGALRRLACRCPWPPKAPGPPRPGPWHALPSARRPQTLTRPRRAAEDTRKRDPG